jgi:crotonobetainyl-CoA:carnitine CoA-transferase CaiB-like acyl-CoA transferase
MASTERFWPRVTRMLDMPELQDDPRFRTAADRTVHHGDFDAIFYPWLVEHTMEEITTAAQREHIPCGPVYTVDRVYVDPSYQARSFFVEIDHPVAGTHVFPGAPVQASEGGWQLRRPAPLLGQHNVEVFGELGLGTEQLASLHERGVI